MKNSNKKSVLFYENFTLVTTSLTKTYIFSSALDKTSFIERYPKDTYSLIFGGNAALVHTYVVIDSTCGFCLNPTRVLTYFEALDTIQHYK